MKNVGDIAVPETITVEGVDYTVTELSEKGLVIKNGIKVIKN